MAQGASVETRWMGRSVRVVDGLAFTREVNRFAGLRETRASAARRSRGSGLGRERVQAAVRFVRNRRTRKFLLDLLVHAGRFLRIALAQDPGELQKHQRTRNKYRGLVRQRAQHLDGLVGLTGARVNNG